MQKTKNKKNKEIKKNARLFALAFALLLTACSEDEYKHFEERSIMKDFADIKAEVKADYFFFPLEADYTFSKDTLKRIVLLLKNTRAAGIDNIEFMLRSETPIPMSNQLALKKQLKKLMFKQRFIKSRIIDKGLCIYKGAKRGVRIGALRYNIERPDCSPWRDSIGDVNTGKDLPNYGFANVYNLEAMVSNKADFVHPRKYGGIRANTAIDALGETGSSSKSDSGGTSDSSSSSSSSTSSSSSSSSQ